MFQKKKPVEKKKEEVPKVPKAPKPQEIEELEETEEEVSEEETPEEESSEEVPEEEDEELTEDDVKSMFKNIATVLNDLTRRVARIEHHLRIDF